MGPFFFGRCDDLADTLCLEEDREDLEELLDAEEDPTEAE